MSKTFIYLSMNVFLSEMQEKEIISIATGLNYGHIVDVVLDNEGNIVSFVAENKKIFRKSFEKDEIRFKFNEIEKIGKDVILVRV
ncbi:MAG: YlmC/YmxH family sporulation protein [Firmicutes bacterium]|nr:YlmC/YmxH family sporulation protein [Bacillota bacterium]